MMNKSALFSVAATSLLALPLLVSCRAEKSVDDFIFFEVYRKERNELLEQAKKRPDFSKMTPQQQVELCRSFRRTIAVTKFSDSPETVSGYEVASCYAAPLLAKAKPHKGYRPKNYAVELINRLDYKSFGNSTSPQLPEDDQHTLSQVSYIKPKTEGLYAAYRDDEDWYQGVCVIADADLNNNGKPDWIIANGEKSKSGTLRSDNLLVAYDVEPTGLIKVSIDLIPHD